MNGGNTTPMKILIYEASLSFLRGACNTRMLRMAVDDYMASMTTSSVVDAIVKSLECRKRVLELSVQLNLTNDPRLRTALRADEEGIATILVSIFNSESDEETVLRLEGDSAQYYLDVVQEALDRGFMMAQEHNRMALRMIRKLSERCDRLPSSLFIVGVNGRDEHPSFGGGYGDIYRASWGDQRVALKRMRYFIRGSDLRRIRLKFCREALVWKDLHHSHILPFLGIDRDTFPSSLCMVSPWMEHGTVMHYLETHGYANVDKLLYEIAQGLEYLHSRNIIHGDLRGANVLIKEDWSACLADFGLSKVFSDDTLTTSTNRGGSLYWMAPELLEPSRFGLKFVRTPATDVYAFGCVCFELYTGRPPFSSLPEPAALMRVLDGERPERQPGLPAMSDRLWQHVTEFWAQSPDTRPSTRSVVQKMVWPTPGPRTVSPLSSTQKAPSAPSTPVDPPRASPINASVLRVNKPEEDILFSFLDIANSDGRDSDKEDAPIMAAGTSRTASPSSPGSSLLSDTSESSNSKVLRSYSLSQTHAGQEILWPSSSDDRTPTPPGKNNKTALKPIGRRSQPIERQGKTLNAILDNVVPSRAAIGSVSRAADLHYVVLPPEITTGHVSRLIIDQFKVLYDYSAAPEDPNEISFSENEIVDLVEQQGSEWCQVRKVDGSVGIAPSNCLEYIGNSVTTQPRYDRNKAAKALVSPSNSSVAVPVSTATATVRYKPQVTSGDFGEYIYLPDLPSTPGLPTRGSVLSDQVAQNNDKYKAKALWPYHARKFDKHELSFSKDEVLDIVGSVDPEGKWWKARNGNGSTGIVPSYYFHIL